MSDWRLEKAEKLERETGFEPATSTLARSHSTTELLPLDPKIIPHLNFSAPVTLMYKFDVQVAVSR